MIRRPLLFSLVAIFFSTAASAQSCLPGASWCSGAYSYDAMGNIRAIGNDVYIYDTAGRLVSGTADQQRNPQGVSRQDYSYDAFGNRISASRANGSVDCPGGCELPVTIDPNTTTNHITSNNVQYDAAGNLTFIHNVVGTTTYDATYSYDTAGRLARAIANTDDRQFLYTADDERIATANGATWTWTVRGLDGKVLREFTSMPDSITGLPTANRQWAKDYVWRDGLLLASVTPTTPGANTTRTQHFHLDHLGTPRLVTGDNGVTLGIHAYYPFGAELNLGLNEQPNELMKFTGHERDVLAGDPHTLDDMHARYEMGTMGRFLSIDPTWDSADLARPQAWNRYSYVLDDPVTLTDPNGKCPVCILVAAGIVGAVLLSGDVANAPAPGDHLIRNSGPASGIGGAIKGILAWGGGNQVTRAISNLLDGRISREDAQNRANRAGDKAAADTKNLPASKRPATVVGATNRSTGQTTTGQSSPGPNGCCAEVDAAHKLGGDPKDIQFSTPTRPRTGEPVPVCKNCQQQFDKTQFPAGTPRQQ